MPAVGVWVHSLRAAPVAGVWVHSLGAATVISTLYSFLKTDVCRKYGRPNENSMWLRTKSYLQCARRKSFSWTCITREESQLMWTTVLSLEPKAVADMEDPTSICGMNGQSNAHPALSKTSFLFQAFFFWRGGGGIQEAFPNGTLEYKTEVFITVAGSHFNDQWTADWGSQVITIARKLSNLWTNMTHSHPNDPLWLA